MADSQLPYDFFLHFHECDHEVAEKIVDYLEDPSNGGFKGFLQDRDSETGTKTHSVDTALRKSRLILVLLSEEALKNNMFSKVLDTCFAYHMRKKYDIVPIYVGKVEKPLIFKTIHGIDYVSNFFWNKLKSRVLKKV